MTDALPPGCAPLHFDPNDRATWERKIIVTGNGTQYPAHIAETDGGRCLASWRLKAGMPNAAWFTDGEGWTGDYEYRLYDAAPEPVKPREWWTELRACAADWRSAASTYRRSAARDSISNESFARFDAMAEVFVRCADTLEREIVRLIEAPEDQT